MAKDRGTLVICPTPLGNLGDMPPRALQALRDADCICCEDTRVTGKLLAALGIAGKRLERLDEAIVRKPANGKSPKQAEAAGDPTVGETVVLRVLEGENIAYCSDAGMPGVSDPGAYLVQVARELNVPVVVLPGPTAVATAYVASGFSCPRFYFGGFFPRKDAERQTVLEQLRALDAVALFYESPNRVASAMEAIAQALPYRDVALCRELTKLHEEVLVEQAPELAHILSQREADGGIKGEIVIVIDAPNADEHAARHDDYLNRAAEAAKRMLAEGELSKKDIVAALRRDFSITRNAAYELVHGA